VHLSRQPATAKPADKAPVHGALSLPDERALVLVVDDERINREILSRMLSDHGHDVLTADSGKVALERLEDQLPDLVLLDVIMSGMSGFDVLKTIRSRYPDGVLPVIMVTAEAGGETVRHRTGFLCRFLVRAHPRRRSRTVYGTARKPKFRGTGAF
jgi:CheY-like chemotaxis protein